jgi:ribonuclease P protein component
LGKDSSVGYTASKKIGKAVKRNKAKRRMRSLVREMAGEFEVGSSFVFVANLNTVNCKFSALKSDFLYCIKKSMKRAKRNENC